MPRQSSPQLPRKNFIFNSPQVSPALFDQEGFSHYLGGFLYYILWAYKHTLALQDTTTFEATTLLHFLGL
jgi:hypothetical protein